VWNDGLGFFATTPGFFNDDFPSFHQHFLKLRKPQALRLLKAQEKG
jgi:hypothetical protein